MKILACGDRNWTDAALVRHYLAQIGGGEDVTLIHGDCRGADVIAAHAAESLGWKVIAFPADWNKHGRRAGPIRNVEMLKQQPDLVIAFHDNLDASRGTAHMVRIAREAGVRVRVVAHAERGGA